MSSFQATENFGAFVPVTGLWMSALGATNNVDLLT